MKNFNSSYIGIRLDLERLISPEAKFVLDVGCSTGTLGKRIKDENNAEVWGIEFSEEMAAEAACKIDKVFIGDATEIIKNGSLNNAKFDVIIFGDVLEHLVDPWTTLRLASSYLKPDGYVITSIPNIRHIDTIYNLLIKGYWPYRERGIHDRTHLRFFTKKNIIELFQQNNFSIELLEANYRLIERPHPFNRFAKYFALPGLRNFLAFQYLIKARLSNNKSDVG